MSQVPDRAIEVVADDRERRGGVVEVLQSIPEVRVRVQRLAAFGSVEAVVRAEREDLKQVAGIGAATASAIRWAVREVGAPYLRDTGDATSGAHRGRDRRPAPAGGSSPNGPLGP